MKFSIQLLLLFALTITTTSCGNPIYGRLSKALKQDKFTVMPNPLKRTGNEIELTISITLPNNLLPFDTLPETEYIFAIRYVPGDVTKYVEGTRPDVEIKLGDFSFKGRDYINSQVDPKQVKTIRFPYTDKYKQGFLVYYMSAYRRLRFAQRYGPYIITSNQKPVTGIVDE